VYRTGYNGQACGYYTKPQEYGCQYGKFEKRCDSTGSKLTDDEQCVWTSPIEDYNTDPGFTELAAQFRLKGKDGKDHRVCFPFVGCYTASKTAGFAGMGEFGQDKVEIAFRTCTSPSVSSCGQWVSAGKHVGHTNDENWQTISMDASFSNTMLTKRHGFVQTKVKMNINEHWDYENEKYEMDWLKIKGTC